MSSSARTVPPPAYLLADHLDATLAAGEDLLDAGARCRAVFHTAADPRLLGPGRQMALREAVELVRSLELALVARILKAREWSETLVRLDPRLAAIGRLFVGGTATLLDALADLSDATDSDFDTADSTTAYFRTRGMLPPELPHLADVQRSLVTETFLVGRRVELGALLDLAAAYLDALEVHFAVFGEPATDTEVDVDLLDDLQADDDLDLIDGDDDVPPGLPAPSHLSLLPTPVLLAEIELAVKVLR
jgi:hypothetical protein